MKKETFKKKYNQSWQKGTQIVAPTIRDGEFQLLRGTFISIGPHDNVLWIMFELKLTHAVLICWCLICQEQTNEYKRQFKGHPSSKICMICKQIWQ